MEENKQAKRSYRRNKPVTKSKVYAIRLDIDLVDFVREQPNMSKFINELIRKEKENTQKEEGMRQKAIEAFKFAVDGYFIIGGTDYSASRLNEFIKKLDS